MKNNGLIGLTMFMQEATEKGFEIGADGSTIIKYHGDSEHVDVPQFVDGKLIRYIGVGAFENKKLKTVKLPLGLGHIMSNAFKNCGLDSLEIPETVYEIDEDAFDGNDRLKLIGPANTKLGVLGKKENLIIIRVPTKSEHNFIMDTRKLLDEYNTPDTVLKHYIPLREEYGHPVYVRALDLKTATTTKVEDDVFTSGTFVIDDNERALPTGHTVNTQLEARALVEKVLYKVYEAEMEQKERVAKRGFSRSSLFS